MGMAETTLHVVGLLTEPALPAFRAAWRPGDRCLALSRQAAAVLAQAPVPFESFGISGDSWPELHRKVVDRLDWSGLGAEQRWDAEPFLLHETTRDFLLCEAVWREVERGAPQRVRWWHEVAFAGRSASGHHLFTAVEKLLGGLSIPVLRGSSGERANLFP